MSTSYGNIFAELEKKTSLFNSMYVATREGKYGGLVDFLTVYGMNHDSLPTTTAGLLKDSSTSTVITLPTGGASATKVKLASTNANDTALGTGARTVYVAGLNETWDKIDETVSLNGQTPVETVYKYSRINRMVVQGVGVNTSKTLQGFQATKTPNIGIIYCGTGTFTSGVPTTIYSTIQAGVGWTRQGLASIPRNYFPYLKTIASVSGTGKSVEYDLVYSFVDSTTGTSGGSISTFTWDNYQAFNSYNFEVSGIYYTGGDFWISALSDSVNSHGMMIAEFILIHNSLLPVAGSVI